MHGHYFHDENGKLRVLRIVWVVIGGLLLAGFLAVGLGWVVQYLWNHTVAVLFHWPLITYWQAVGLFLLGKLLFGGMGHGHKHKRGRGCGRHWEEKWGGHHGQFHQYWENEGRAAYQAYLDRLKS